MLQAQLEKKGRRVSQAMCKEVFKVTSLYLPSKKGGRAEQYHYIIEQKGVRGPVRTDDLSLCRRLLNH